MAGIVISFPPRVASHITNSLSPSSPENSDLELAPGRSVFTEPVAVASLGQSLRHS